MEPKLQNRIQRSGWDRAAARYEAAWNEQLRPAQDRLLGLACLRKGEHIADIACAAGAVTVRMAQAVGAQGRVVGFDISGQMVALAQRTHADVANLSFARAPGDVLPAGDAAFDAALCAFGLMYVPEPRAALCEMRRVLKPGGRAAAAVWGARANCGWAEIFPIVDARVESEVCPLFFRLGVGDCLAAEFREAGFHGVEAERMHAYLRYASADEALEAAFAAGPVALAYSKFSSAVREEAHAEYLVSIERYRDGGGYAVEAEFVLAIGRA